MTKEELVHITLKSLCESLKTTPENFRLEDPSLGSNGFPGPTVIWQFKVEVEANKFISDPLNSTKTIIVSYNSIARQLTCQIYNKEINTMSYSGHADTSAVVQYHQHLPLSFNRSYRMFMRLRRDLIARKNEKEYLDYMKKLNAIFPTTGTDELFK